MTNRDEQPAGDRAAARGAEESREPVVGSEDTSKLSDADTETGAGPQGTITDQNESGMRGRIGPRAEDAVHNLGEVRVIGHQWSPEAHAVKDFLARNRVPYQCLDIEDNQAAGSLVQSVDPEQRRFPLLLFPDGSHLAQPTDRQIAEHIGLHTEAEASFYDLIIVGGGPAGLAAAVYGASEGLRTIVVEREAPGGQAGTSPRIENYLGFPEGLSGGDLARRAMAQAERLEAEVLAARKVINLSVDGAYRVVTLEDGAQLHSHAVLIATGATYRKLDVPGSDALTGAGVYYGAASAEAFTLRNRDVCLLGGGNSAGQAAMLLSRYARTVTVLTKGDSLDTSMSQYLVERIRQTQQIRVRPHSRVVEVRGEQRLTAIVVEQTETHEVETIPTDALFVFIGMRPQTDWLADLVERDGDGFVLSGPDLAPDGTRPAGWPLGRDPFFLETSVPGVFVAGDALASSTKRITAAVGEGAMVIPFIHQYLRDR